MALYPLEAIRAEFDKANERLAAFKPSYTRVDGVCLMRAGGPNGKFAVREDGVGKLIPITKGMILVGDEKAARRAMRQYAREQYRLIASSMVSDFRLFTGEQREYQLVRRVQIGNIIGNGTTLTLPEVSGEESIAFHLKSNGDPVCAIITPLPQFETAHREVARLNQEIQVLKEHIKILEAALPNIDA